MMRIKEAIQRKKLIHEMNEEWKDFELDGKDGKEIRLSTPLPTFTESEKIKESEGKGADGLQNFVQYLSSKLNEYQKRALKVTWKRLSEAPKTSGRGTIHIMEKVLSKMYEKEPAINAIFYKSAFLSCIEDRRCGRTLRNSISTIRDHAHILVEFVDAILQCMFDGVVKEGFDPEMIGMQHCRLLPLGFERRMWHVLGECFAEVMFNQECIRAYPHAPSAWSLLAVTMTDKMYAASRPSQVRRDQSADTPRSPRTNSFVSPPSSISNSNEEVFYTARSDFSERKCPFVHHTSSSVDVPRQLARESRNEYRNHRFHSQHSASGNDYFLRKHPILIPRPLFNRSQSEVRFSAVPMPAPAMPVPTKTTIV